MKTKLALVLGVATLAVTPVFAKAGHDTLQFSYREAFTNSGVEPDATGTVNVNETVAGNANKQTLDVTVAGLTISTEYHLSADVNGSGATDLGSFTTDANGKATLHLMSIANGHNAGKGKIALPDGFDLSQVIQFTVLDGSSTVVLASDTTAPTSLKYSVRRSLTNGAGVDGTLQISSSKSKTKFSLTASGLDSNTDYQLVFNGVPVQTNTTDSHGRLKINDATLPDNILDLQSVEIWDSSNTEVIGTTTPLP